jgi:hypothetical protein
MAEPTQSPAVDLNKLSTEDLLAIKSGDLNKVSTEGLLMLKASQPQAEQQPQPKREIPAYQSAIVGGGKGVTEPLLAAGQYMGGAPAEFSNEVLRRMKPFQEANPTTFGAGQLGGGMLSGGALMKSAGMIPSFAKLGPYLQSSAIGGMMGVLTPNEQGKSGLDMLAEAPQKAVVGAGGGVIGTGLGRTFANVVGPNLDAAVRKLIGEGVNLTPGQMMGGIPQRIEDKLTSVPLLGDLINYSKTKGIEEFNKASYRRALEPIGGKVPEETGRAGMESVKNQISGAYNELLPKLTYKPDNQFLTSLSNVKNQIEGIDPDNAKKVADTVFDVVSKRLDKNGEIKGEAFKVVEEKLGNLAKTYRASQDADQKMMGDAYANALGELRQNLARNNPQFAEQLGKINTSFANFARLRSAGSMANTQERFTPSQLAAAVKSADQSSGKGATATGNALMQDLSDAGVQVLPSKIPDTGTAGRQAVNTALAALLGGGGYQTAQTHPIATGTAALLGAAASAPYLPGGRSLVTMIGAKRPESIQKLADFIRESSPYLAAPGAQKAVEKSENK